MEKLENLKIQALLLFVLQVIATIVVYFLGSTNLAYTLGISVSLNGLIVFWIIYRYDKVKQEINIDISRILGQDAKDALEYGELGIVTYDDNYEITWVSEFLIQRNYDIIGKKAGSWFEVINDLFKSSVDKVIAKDGMYTYEIFKKDNSQVLYVKDITSYNNLYKKYSSESIVVGLLHLDNYMEVSQYEDEAKLSLINANLRQPLVDWARKYGMLIRRLRSDRYLVILDEEILNKISKDHFNILNTIRTASSEIDAAITLSMAFAKGTKDLTKLDIMVNDVLELALTRGGDQVALRKYGDETKFFGGNSEAQEKRSKVRVRVMANALREAILDSENVYIVGHKNMDFDSMGAALFMSRLVTSYDKKAYIVSKSGGVEAQLANTLETVGKSINNRHYFISDSEASKKLKRNDLVIVVDHHSPSQTGAPLLIEKCDKLVIVDHHRRSTNFMENPMLVYVEASASSVSELVAEFIPYCNNIDINDTEATILYLGILVDTNRFKTRTGSRTFEACAILKKYGVDPTKAEESLKEDFDEFIEKSAIINNSIRVHDNIVIATSDDNKYTSRTLMSQVADYFLTIKGIEAAFVIGREGDKFVNISARSKGIINVQIIMESLGGGGHFTMAALQKESVNIDEMKQILENRIDEYILEEKDNETDINR